MGPHETTMQSTVVIRCNKSTGGFKFTESQFVTILNITLTECATRTFISYPSSHSHPYSHPHPHFSAVGLYLKHLRNTYLQHISIYNASGIGLNALGCFNLTIEDSSFFYNQFPVGKLVANPVDAKKAHGANVAVSMSCGLPLHSHTSNKLSIVRSNFSFSLGEHHKFGSGLTIYLGERKLDVLIDNVVAYSNSGRSNINIICNTTQYAITINNTRSLYRTSISPNAVNIGGAGFYLKHSYNNATEAKLFVYNSDFSVHTLVPECLLFGWLVQLVK